MASPLFAAAVAVTFAAPTHAQSLAAPRATAAPRSTSAIAGDTVRAASRTPGLADPAPVLMSAPGRRIESQRSRRARFGRAIAGGVLGLLAGALVGGVVGVLCGYLRNARRGYYEGLGRIASGVVIGAGVGMAGGTYLGARAPVPVWEPVPLPERIATP